MSQTTPSIHILASDPTWDNALIASVFQLLPYLLIQYMKDSGPEIYAAFLVIKRATWKYV